MDALIAFLQQFSQALAEGTLVVEWGREAYLILALLVLVEGPIATLLGAAAASAGFMNPYLVFLAASAGNLTADMLWYRLGYAGRIEWLLDHGRWLGVRRAHIERLTRDMHRHARKLLVIAKLTVSVAVPTLIATGIAKVPWRKWFGAVFLAEFVWTGALVYLGYHFTRSLPRLEAWLQVVAIISVGVFLGIIGRYVYRMIKGWSDAPDLEARADD